MSDSSWGELSNLRPLAQKLTFSFETQGEWNFKMVQITDFGKVIPPNLVGKYRVSAENWFLDTEKTECTRLFVDIAEV
jgi:hypothetical protein